MLRPILLLIILSFSICSAQSNVKFNGVWTIIDSLRYARFMHASIVLPNGNILVSGGNGNGASKSCEIYDLKTQKWRITDSMNTGRSSHKMFLLKNNKVIAVGGFAQRSCEIFDPETERWAYADSIPILREMWESVLQLHDGSILISGGLKRIDIAPFTIPINDCELYNPETGKWKAVAQLNIARRSHTMTELNNGKILAAGGMKAGGVQLKSCEIYDPVQDTWTIVDSLNIQRSSHASYLLANGNVLVAGGYFSTSTTFFPQNTCEVYNSVSNTWTIAGNLQNARSNFDIYLLKDYNKLLIPSPYGITVTWEAYDPESLISLSLGNGPINKMTCNFVQMQDGRIMLSGGEDISSIETLPSRAPSNKSYILSIEQVLAVEKTNEIPKDFYLYQNFPNPFNPSTKIKFSITKSSRVFLIVYDLLGRIISKLIDNEEKSAGVYAIDFNGSGLSSGIYLYQLTAGNNTTVNKLVLTK